MKIATRVNMPGLKSVAARIETLKRSLVEKRPAQVRRESRSSRTGNGKARR